MTETRTVRKQIPREGVGVLEGVSICYAATHCVGLGILEELEYQTTTTESKFLLVANQGDSPDSVH